MTTLVLTVIGDDRSGLVGALSGVVADHGGNWDRSQMARLGGKFAGIVMVTVPDRSASALLADLEPLSANALRYAVQQISLAFAADAIALQRLFDGSDQCVFARMLKTAKEAGGDSAAGDVVQLIEAINQQANSDKT